MLFRSEAVYNTIYKKTSTGNVVRKEPSRYLLEYLEGQGVILSKDAIDLSQNKSENSEILKDFNNIQLPVVDEKIETLEI